MIAFIVAILKLLLPAIMEELDAPDTAIDADLVDPDFAERLRNRVRAAKRDTGASG